MASKKTNYIEYELQKFEGYVKDLQDYLDNNPIADITDRLDVRESVNGNPIVKTIASKEQQLKAYRETVEKLANLLAALNSLRKLAEYKGEDVSKRGGGDLPGIFKNRLLKKDRQEEDDDYDDE